MCVRRLKKALGIIDFLAWQWDASSSEVNWVHVLLLLLFWH
jgi:hypothetical protein